MLTKEDYRSAINCQDACNLSGIVHSFSKVMNRIWDEARAKGEGTDWVNRHPICVLYSSKISSLTGSEMDTAFPEAYASCMAGAEGA